MTATRVELQPAWPLADSVTAAVADREPVIVLVAATLACLAYRYGLGARALEPRFARARDPQAASVLAQHALGGVLFGATALLGGLALDLGPAGIGLVPAVTRTTAVGTASAYAALLGLLLVATRRTRHWQSYPEIRAGTWTPALVAKNALAWAVYLAGYELFFRGFLLLAMVRWVGVPGGVAITTALYALQHLPKEDPGEALGCLPMGALFAWLTLASGGSVLLAFLLHVAMAVSSDLLTLWNNPALRVLRGGP